MKLASGIQLTDGSILDEAFSELKEKVKSLSGISSNSGNVDITQIENKISELTTEIDALKTKVEEIIIPDNSKFITSDVTDGLSKSIEEISVKVNAIVVPDVSDYAKADSVTTLTNTLNQLVNDLQAGKYNVSGGTATTNTNDTSTVSK